MRPVDISIDNIGTTLTCGCTIYFINHVKPDWDIYLVTLATVASFFFVTWLLPGRGLPA